MVKNTEQMKREKTMKGKYLSPKADLTFKLVFAEHKDLMMSFLNALLPLPENAPITSIDYLTPEMVPENDGKKNSVVDVRCTDALKRHFIVEMQMQWSESFKRRVVMNSAKAVIKQVGEGENFMLLRPVFSLNIVNQNIPDEAPDEYYHDYAILNVAHPERSIDYLRLVFVELPKFQPRNIMEKKMAVLWLRFLTEINEETVEAPLELLENEQIRKALSIVEKSAMTDEQLYAYERFWDAINVENALAEDRFNRGLEEGRAEGEAKGRAEGEAKGRAEGRAEERLANARSLKANGVPLDIIAKSLALSTEELAQL